jgi:hypothetical protein
VGVGLAVGDAVAVLGVCDLLPPELGASLYAPFETSIPADELPCDPDDDLDVPPVHPVSNRTEGYLTALALAYCDYWTERWATTGSPEVRQRAELALMPMGIRLPWPEDLEEIEGSYRNKDRPDVISLAEGYHVEPLDLAQAVLLRRLPGDQYARQIGGKLMDLLSPELRGALVAEAKRRDGPITDGLVIESLLAAVSTAWALRCLQPSHPAIPPVAKGGHERLSHSPWNLLLDASRDRPYVSWWLGWGPFGVGNGTVSNLAWEGAPLEWLAAVAPPQELADFINNVERARKSWLETTFEHDTADQLVDVVAELSRSSTPVKKRYIPLLELSSYPHSPKVECAVESARTSTIEMHLSADRSRGRQPFGPNTAQATRFIGRLCLLDAQEWLQVVNVLFSGRLGSIFRSRLAAQVVARRSGRRKAWEQARFRAFRLAESRTLNYGRLHQPAAVVSMDAVGALVLRDRIGERDFARLYGPFEQLIPLELLVERDGVV